MLLSPSTGGYSKVTRELTTDVGLVATAGGEVRHQRTNVIYA
jgi:hypothetical protein